MASIRRRGNKWQIRIKIKGHPEVAQTLPTKALAQQFAADMEAKIYRGLYFGPGYDKTLSEACAYYLERVAPIRLAAKTIETHKTALEIWCASEMGDRLLAQITAGDIAAVRDSLVRRYKNASVNRYFVALSAVLSMAEEREWIQINPCRKLRKLPDDSKREVALDDRESQTLLNACERTDRSLYLLVLAALETGARRGELESLTWDDVDFEARTLTFRDTKNGDTRSIPLPTALSTYLQLLSGQSDQRPFTPLNQKLWDRARDAVDLRHVRFHDLRHTCATRLAKQGCSLRQIAALLGHRSLNMVMRYSHLDVEDLRSLVS